IRQEGVPARPIQPRVAAGGEGVRERQVGVERPADHEGVGAQGIVERGALGGSDLEAERLNVHGWLRAPAYQTRLGKPLSLLDFPGTEEAGTVIKVSLKDAEGDLEHLVEEAADGEEVIITRRDGARFRIVPLPHAEADSQEVSAQPGVIGNSLDRFIGIWSAEEEAEFL